VNAIYEKLFKEILGDRPFISEKFSIDFGQQVGPGKWITVVNIAGSKDKIQQLSIVVDDKMYLESKEPANATVAFGCKSFENLIRVFSLDMIGFQWCRVNIGYASTFPLVPCFKENNQRFKNRMC
jgi:hypothetical protein